MPRRNNPPTTPPTGTPRGAFRMSQRGESDIPMADNTDASVASDQTPEATPVQLSSFGRRLERLNRNLNPFSRQGSVEGVLMPEPGGIRQIPVAIPVRGRSDISNAVPAIPVGPVVEAEIMTDDQIRQTTLTASQQQQRQDLNNISEQLQQAIAQPPVATSSSQATDTRTAQRVDDILSTLRANRLQQGSENNFGRDGVSEALQPSQEAGVQREERRSHRDSSSRRRPVNEEAQDQSNQRAPENAGSRRRRHRSRSVNHQALESGQAGDPRGNQREDSNAQAQDQSNQRAPENAGSHGEVEEKDYHGKMLRKTKVFRQQFKEKIFLIYLFVLIPIKFQIKLLILMIYKIISKVGMVEIHLQHPEGKKVIV